MEGQTTVRSSERGWEMREHRPRKGPGTLGKLCLRGTGQLGTTGQSDGRAFPEHGCCGPGGSRSVEGGWSSGRICRARERPRGQVLPVGTDRPDGR